MAENSESGKSGETTPAAVLRPGRQADAAPVGADSALTAEQRASALEPGFDGYEEAGETEELVETDQMPDAGDDYPDEPGEDDEGGLEQVWAQSRQRQLRLMLSQCDRVLLMDFDLLAMQDWPDNYQMAEARRSRDVWIFSILAAATVFLSGVTGFVPAWVAGGGFGASVIILLLGVPVIRRVYTSKPSYMELVLKRQNLLKDARKHIAHLEGKEGLIWQCTRMADYNHSLKHPRFSRLLQLSENRVLARSLNRREHIRLYLIYLLEAEKAYNRVQAAFFEGNQQALENGWEEVVASPPSRT